VIVSTEVHGGGDVGGGGGNGVVDVPPQVPEQRY
jgi:hypothetical protein